MSSAESPLTTSEAPQYFIGLMSGTSLDAIDTVICTIDSANNFSLLYSETYPIPDQIKKDLLTLSQKQQANELDQYAKLDVQMGHLFADCCLHLLAKNNLKPEQICAIGSHGQTLRHYPENQYPTTLQIGDPNIIAHSTGITTIADFRRKDMAAGGQGAPLVPPFHQALFKDINNEINRVVVNIGGIANITFLPASSDGVLGYDTGPGNGLMDDWCIQHFNCAYDPSGSYAALGKVDSNLLTLLLSDPFLAQKAPKSTGREYFSYQWIKIHLKQAQYEINPLDVLTTLLELTCLSISNEVSSLRPAVSELLVCGGGVKNTLLMQRLQELMPEVSVSSTEKHGLHPDWVEASAFAWLAHQTLNGLTANLPSVTGARNKVILGAIWQA
ncbi:MAG: anhydro-N-acetylmuramic acid kinase [gamma proteobacterium symbiont of Bathyaustriella thionipta]|nr:anhydro-N-acetylmuramic acid kinase [gamma proteobacterium symbiont of Bathyaustriella thionipta]MCU7950919.1 anhydro-N-acetylmuramic acid kinase [gamma proteobacterium symbiont of Bathyaustriella thionipta]MCU7951820.1 anhydro-N-acetylmuramic acid kinase [gamma proteobacterium symbiont of Bathyaustriella thionipta]MCU7957394.1 anhydro-N-acetylmuramic acid kinase [gamma proteobacterium symbiont of Bathyaustriella thionipta]MCU7967666.1 anhydro-N-acetylmuramic acid kinase [gamma proteobacteri